VCRGTDEPTRPRQWEGADGPAESKLASGEGVGWGERERVAGGLGDSLAGRLGVEAVE
jgi:hypothetical protein